MPRQTDDSILGNLRLSHQERYAEQEWFHKRQKELKQTNRPEASANQYTSAPVQTITVNHFFVGARPSGICLSENDARVNGSLSPSAPVLIS
jgi:hypothetical protein